MSKLYGKFKTKKHQVYLGIGGNTGCRKTNMQSAVSLIDKNAGRIIKSSSWYMAEPWGFEHKKYFLNAVLFIETKLSPAELLKKCNKIENELSRIKNNSGKYTGRTMDIDILFYDNEIIKTKKLQVPHPLLHLRNFVLIPFAEISQAHIHPVYKKTIFKLKYLCNDELKVRKLKNTNKL